MGILFPPSIFFLEFKSREELMLQPQTAAEHEQDINNSSSSSSGSSSSDSSSSSDTDSEEELNSNPGYIHSLKFNEKKRESNSSIHSLNLASVCFYKFLKKFNF